MNRSKPKGRSPVGTPTRRPGESLEREFHDEYALPWLYFAGAAIMLALCAGIAWWYHIFDLGGLHWTLTVGAAALIAVTLLKFRTLKTTGLNYLLGAKGERAVGDILDQLRRERGYHVIHDIPIYKGGRKIPATLDERPVANIDHVLIGPAGVLVIETKTLSKPAGRKAVVRFEGERLLVDGRTLDRDPIAQARRNAADVRAMIRDALGNAQEADKVPVRPVVLFPGWWVEEAKGTEVWVLNPERLFAWMCTAEQTGRPNSPKGVSSQVAAFLDVGKPNRF